MTTPAIQPSVVVVGGGLAGLSAAVTAADAGWAVTLLESRARLGGATHSFSRAFEDGEIVVDNGQHVFLRCCTAYREFIARLGVEDQTYLQPRLDVPVIDPGTGRIARLRRDRLPAPLHLSRALLTYRLLTPWQRIRAIVAMLKLDRVDRDAPSSDTQTFGSWLAAHGQSKKVLERLIDVFTVATLNAPSAQVSLTLGAMVFQDGLLRKADACDIGMSRVPLGQLHGDAAAAALATHDADIRLRTRVRAITALDGNQWRVDTDDMSIEADAVVLAVPHDVAADLLPAGSVADPAAVRGLDVSPILNVHVIFDRVVLTEPFIAAVDSPAQFVFDRTKASGLRSGQYVAVSVSAADTWIDQPVAQLREQFMPELLRVLPAARDAVVRDFFVTREREATFRPVPGSAARRLHTTTNAPGLVVAGAWTATGWPATMESAVRSGVAAVHALQEWRAATGKTAATVRTEAAVHEASA
ncbi:MAG TPA: hydroxysqualene dehydroxylase HpnE [Acidothermaceae bacterium]|jgi:squalene-associated FAD-dependent desaturase